MQYIAWYNHSSSAVTSVFVFLFFPPSSSLIDKYYILINNNKWDEFISIWINFNICTICFVLFLSLYLLLQFYLNNKLFLYDYGQYKKLYIVHISKKKPVISYVSLFGYTEKIMLHLCAIYIYIYINTKRKNFFIYYDKRVSFWHV